MKKVNAISLSGLVFAIEDDAYTALSSYLEQIRGRLEVTDDFEEINADLEMAIAEKFSARGKDGSVAVTVLDVDGVIAELGSPAEFGEETTTEGSAAATNTATEASENAKRLYRDTDQAIIGGVCAGVANYLNIDPLIVRLLFVGSIFLNGIGILIYIVLWLLVPAAQTTEEKYAMRGDQVTLKEISERVKKNVGSVDAAALRNQAASTWGGIRPIIESFFAVVGRIFSIIVPVVRIATGVIATIFGAIGVALIIFLSTVLWSSDPASPLSIVSETLTEPTDILFFFAALVVLFVPVLAMLMLGVSLLRGKNIFSATNTAALIISWIIALVMAVALGASYATRLASESAGWVECENGNCRSVFTNEQIGEIKLHIDETDDSLLLQLNQQR
ncbi:PspC domain-containing protein [Candidatus Pacebacteria bacterium]|nr:PspC domain-containing protein [Candidatus Paceibacterota bacterium]